MEWVLNDEEELALGRRKMQEWLWYVPQEDGRVDMKADNDGKSASGREAENSLIPRLREQESALSNTITARHLRLFEFNYS